MYTIELHNNIEMWVRVEEHNRAFASASQSTSALHPSIHPVGVFAHSYAHITLILLLLLCRRGSGSHCHSCCCYPIPKYHPPPSYYDEDGTELLSILQLLLCNT